jgi:hypothetical protein
LGKVIHVFLKVLATNPIAAATHPGILTYQMEDKRELLTVAELLEIHPKVPCRTFNPVLYRMVLEEVMLTSGLVPCLLLITFPIPFDGMI